MLMVVCLSTLLASSVIPVAFAKAPDDTFYPRLWYLRQIGAEAAWEKTTGSDQVVVAVIDTGVAIDHEDLRDNIWTNAADIPSNGADDDGNGFVDDVHGWNFLTKTGDVRPREDGSTDAGFVHGTLVASLIGARGNNGIGVTGVAWRVKIMPVVALDETGGGSSSDVAEAIRYAVENGAHIINLSLEGYTDSADLSDALSFATSRGVLTVAASGNAPEDPNGIDLDVLRVYPACLSRDPSYGVIAVGGTDTLDQKALYSNYGSCVNVLAPSYDLFGARPVSLAATSSDARNGYEGGFNGTSLAAPLVAGVAALLKSVHPLWRADELKARLMSSAIPIEGMRLAAYQGKLGQGRIDAALALADASTSTVASYSVSATVPGRQTRVRVSSGKSVVDIQPYGAKDTRGARAVFTDTDADGIPEIVVVPASGRELTYAIYALDGRERRRTTVARDLVNGTLVASVTGGVVIADQNGGRAWGVAHDGTVTSFRPYGPAYRAGLDLLAISGVAAFVPRGGGGHLMATDVKGRRLVSVFPFGTSARGRWSLARLPAVSTRPESLVVSGPLGSSVLNAARLGATGWATITLKDLETAKPVTSAGRASGDAAVRIYDEWSR